MESCFLVPLADVFRSWEKILLLFTFFLFFPKMSCVKNWFARVNIFVEKERTMGKSNKYGM